MAISVQTLAAALQTLLTTTADRAAKDSGFVRRVRKMTGAGFVQSLVLGWMADPHAKLEDLATTLGIAVQSLQERFNDQAVDCLRRVLGAAMGYLFEARPETIPLLRRFTAVAIDDSTAVALPAALAGEYPGCGGSDPDAGRAGLKVLARLEAITGRLELSEPAPGSASDRTLHATSPPLPRGSLRLADLGFFDLERMAADAAAGVHWISRAPARLRVRRGGEAVREPARVAATAGVRSDRYDRHRRDRDPADLPTGRGPCPGRGGQAAAGAAREEAAEEGAEGQRGAADALRLDGDAHRPGRRRSIQSGTTLDFIPGSLASGAAVQAVEERLPTPESEGVDARIKSAQDDFKLLRAHRGHASVVDTISPDSPALSRE